jgi:hypothetical protein
MAVWLSQELQTSAYWQEVQALGNELLDQSPPRPKEWTIRVRPKTGGDAEEIAADQEREAQELWYAKADFPSRELTVGVPAGDAEAEETEPEDAATYLVFDILDAIVNPNDEGPGDWWPNG